jgi:hypothetical protein
MKKRVLMGLACAGAVALLVAMVAGAAASPNGITLLSRAGIPFVSKWAGAPGPGGAVAVTSLPGSWDKSLLAEGAIWIWSESPVTGGRGVSGDVIEFTDTFELECTPISAQLALDITADNEYRVYLNGTLVADSVWKEVSATCPGRYIDDREYLSLHHEDISEPFQSGTNTLVFEVLNLPCYTDSGNPGGLIYKAVITYDCPIQVQIDIKPGSYPNCFNVNGHGVIPVAILGSADFDVTQVDVGTLEFAGLDVRVKGNDKPQCSVEDVSGDFTSPEGAPDGHADLVCQFVDDSTWSADDGTATLSGNLKADYGGTPFEGSDEICLRPE